MNLDNILSLLKKTIIKDDKHKEICEKITEKDVDSMKELLVSIDYILETLYLVIKKIVQPKSQIQFTKYLGFYIRLNKDLKFKEIIFKLILSYSKHIVLYNVFNKPHWKKFINTIPLNEYQKE